jgi:radical SAM-linked protein
MECDLELSRKHLERAVALHKEVRTYEERISAIKEQAIDRPLVQLTSSVEEAREERAEARLNRYRAVFEKGEGVKYLSHLDLTRQLPRAFRRAKITLGYSQGFHPMPLIQYGPALGVGVVGEREMIDFDSPDLLEEAEFLFRINSRMPEGLRFVSLAKLPAGSPSLIKVINRAEYSLPLGAPEIGSALLRIRAERADLSGLEDEEIQARLADEFLCRESWVIDRVRKDKRQRVDVRRYTLGLGLSEDRASLHIVTEISPSGGVKPVEVVAAIYGLSGDDTISLSSRVRRIRLYRDDAADPASLPGRAGDAGGASEHASLAARSQAGD